MAAIELMNSSQNHTMRMLDSEKPARELTFRKFSLLPYMSSEKSLSKRKTPFYPPPILHTLQHNSVNLDEAFPASQNRFHQRTYSVQETVRAEIAHNCVSPFESVLSDSNYSISSSGLESASIDDDDSDRAGICDDIGTFCQSGTNELGENTKVDRVEACNMNCSFDSGTGALVEHVDDLQFQRRKVDKSRALENRSSSVCETSQNTTKNKRKQALKNSIRAFSVSHPIGFSSRIKNLQS